MDRRVFLQRLGIAAAAGVGGALMAQQPVSAALPPAELPPFDEDALEALWDKLDEDVEQLTEEEIRLLEDAVRLGLMKIEDL